MNDINGYILLKNGKTKLLKNKKIKKSKTNGILLKIKSDLFGVIYQYIAPNTYNKLNKQKNFEISYNFINGIIIEEDDYDNLKIKYKYKYNNKIDLCKRITELAMTECALNDIFWVYEAYYLYAFYDLKIKLTNKNGTKKMSFDKFYKYIYKNNINYDNFIKFIYDGKQITLMRIVDDYYIEINPKLLNKKNKYKIESKFKTKFAGKTSDKNIIRYTCRNINGLSKLFIINLYDKVLNKLNDLQVDDIIFKIKSKVYFKNKSIGIHKFIKKYICKKS